MLQEMGFHKGIDLGGWLSQCDYSEERLNNFITEADFEKIASWGLDHVRIPIDYNVLEHEDGSFREDGFARLDKAVGWAKKYALKVVIDLHKTAGFSFDDGEQESGFFEKEACQERFYRLWEEIAKRFGQYADIAVFELLNEVTEKRFIDVWNKVSYECIRRIRGFAPDTLILVGSYGNNSAEAVSDLAPPYDDKVIYNFHCYDPLKFTHQGATWTDKIIPEERLPFAQTGLTEDYFEELFRDALETAERYGTELYCGEYGVIDIVSPEDALEWFRLINAVFEKHGIARAAWSYKQMDFGLSDARMDGVRDELLKVL